MSRVGNLVGNYDTAELRRAYIASIVMDLYEEHQEEISEEEAVELAGNIDDAGIIPAMDGNIEEYLDEITENEEYNDDVDESQYNPYMGCNDTDL